MALSPGTRFGPYEVADEIGAGGMGVVYRATDTTLDREVAIKVLPESMAADAERITRFDREAKMLASLNHPNIAQIYGLERSDDTTALVMELVEGPTLADRIEQGPLPIDEALGIAMQIAEALEGAHGQSIVHRDLKPANIKLRPDGTVKVLDFGIAKALEQDVLTSAPQSPMLTTPATQVGVILGTAAYMSPEQAKGKQIDQRADIWAFGCVLYEMLTGQPAFGGEDVPTTLARVIANDTDMESLPDAISPAVRQTLRLCLRKDVRKRVADIRDVSLALEGEFETVSPRGAERVAEAQPIWRRTLPSTVTAVVAVLVTGLTAWNLWPTADPPRVTRLTIALADGQPLAIGNNSPDLALSPDGTRVVYRVLVDEQPTLVIRALDTLEATVLYEGSNNGPFFSPDGAWVGFNDQSDDTIKRVAVTGGPALTIGAVGAARLAGATWGEDDTIVFGTSATTGLSRIPVGGGTPEPLTTLDEAQGESNHEWPELLPGGEAVIFTIRRAGEDADTAQIAVRHLGTGEQRVLVSGGSYPKYVSTGHLLYGYAGTLRAVPFDLDQLTVTGNPVAVLEGVITKAQSGAADVAVAEDGSLVYVSGEGGGASYTLVWVDREGQEEPLAIEARPYQDLALSPDGTRLAVAVTETGNSDIWVYDLERGSSIRLTFEPTMDHIAVWSPDGEQIVFSVTGAAQNGMLRRAADGTGQAEPLTSVDDGSHDDAGSFSPDGTRLVYRRANPSDLFMLSLEGERTPQPLVATQFDERLPTVSPDGRWLAYISNESGQYEVYVRPFPDVEEGKWSISRGGGDEPRWNPQGGELFYRAGQAMMVVSVETERTFSHSNPRALFTADYPTLGTARRSYDVSPDGQRFLAIKEGGTEGTTTQIIVVQNWFEELKRLVPSAE